MRGLGHGDAYRLGFLLLLLFLPARSWKNVDDIQKSAAGVLGKSDSVADLSEKPCPGMWGRDPDCLWLDVGHRVISDCPGNIVRC